MPNTLATAVCPSDAAQIVARNRPIDVAVRMIGRAAPIAAAGTTPTRARPSETEPAMKHGRPRAAGSPVSGPGVAGATGGSSCSVRAADASALITSLLRVEHPRSRVNASVRRGQPTRVLTLNQCLPAGPKSAAGQGPLPDHRDAVADLVRGRLRDRRTAARLP